MATVRYRWIDGAAPPESSATAEPTFSDVMNGWAVVDRENTRSSPTPTPAPVVRPRVVVRTAFPVEPPIDESPLVGDRAAAVRPYLWTHGRTRVSRSLSVETLVSTSARGRAEMGRLRPEHRAPAELCGHTRSVSEVAALLSVPLGVARVLIDEMADLGIVVVHAGSASDGPPDLSLMKRVLDGLHRL